MERRKFTSEFKLEAVRLIKDRGVSDVQASQDLNAFGWGKRSDRPLQRTLEPRVSLEAGLVAHCSACLMSMMAAWCAAVGAPSCATDFIAARTASMCELIMSVVLRAAST